MALSGWRSTYPDPEAWFWLTFGEGIVGIEPALMDDLPGAASPHRARVG